MSASARAFLCECGERRCRGEARLTEAEYAELRRAGLKMVVAAHETPPAIVVDRGPGWVAVGRARRLVTKPQVQVEDALYCAACGQETLPGPSGRCLWCSGELVSRGVQAA